VLLALALLVLAALAVLQAQVDPTVLA